MVIVQTANHTPSVVSKSLSSPVRWNPAMYASFVSSSSHSSPSITRSIHRANLSCASKNRPPFALSACSTFSLTSAVTVNAPVASFGCLKLYTLTWNEVMSSSFILPASAVSRRPTARTPGATSRRTSRNFASMDALTDFLMFKTSAFRPAVNSRTCGCAARR